MGQLDGRVAIVTGGAKSIGKAFAMALAREGASVAIGDIVDGTATAEEIAKETGQQTLSRVMDVGSEPTVQDFVLATHSRFGRIDILVNNAALFAELPRQPHTEISGALWDRIMQVNIKGPWLMTKHVSPHMVAAGYGKIVNIGSDTANKGVPNMLGYVTSKGAILGMTRSLARELGPHGICVNTIAPGLTASESAQAKPGVLANNEGVISRRSIPRTQTEQDLVGTLLWLAGPGSDFVTGQTIAVNGGETAS
ncbi:MAG: SDR family oxidoreductase [Alphaproteobacteria bacterium]|jgi:NAD(P)-dependent dehydrogenase (short-subunit alcohol dehydrogenase family)